MIEKLIVLSEIAPVMYNGVNNPNIQLIKA